MSLICLCVVENIAEKSKVIFYSQQIETLAKQNEYGIKFSVDWDEPIMSNIRENSFIINILDSPQSDNCELFLLPDGWYINGNTSKFKFIERMKFLQDIFSLFNDDGYTIELYFGQSGTIPEEFYNVILKNDDLVEYLVKTIGVCGVDDGVHISVIP